MFFEEHLKKIYKYGETSYDPLRVDLILRVESDNRLNEYIDYRNAYYLDLGDISPEGKKEKSLLAAKAELELARIARSAFSLPPFPDCTDAQALEVLFDFMEWMSGKGEVAGKPQGLLENAPRS